MLIPNLGRTQRFNTTQTTTTAISIKKSAGTFQLLAGRRRVALSAMWRLAQFNNLVQIDLDTKLAGVPGNLPDRLTLN